MKKQKREIIKWALYSLVLLICYTIQSAPRFLQIYGAKPMLIISLAICVAMFEGEFAGSLFGVVCGLFMDLYSSKFFGFYSILCLLLCLTCALLISFFVQRKLWSSVLMALGSITIISLADLFFFHILWGHDGILNMLLRVFLPNILYTTLVTPILYLLVKAIHTRLADPAAQA